MVSELGAADVPMLLVEDVDEAESTKISVDSISGGLDDSAGLGLSDELDLLDGFFDGLASEEELLLFSYCVSGSSAGH